MKFSDYLRDHVWIIMFFAAASALSLLVMIAFKTHIFVTIFTVISYILLGFSLILIGFFRKRTFYNKVTSTLSAIDKKYLLSEMINRPDFLEGEIFYETICATSKSMNDEIAAYKNKVADFKDFIEMWVHEIKTPLSKLNLQTNDRKTAVYLREIENYIDQTLFYSKLDTIDKDYVIKKIDLNDVINNVIKDNKDNLIRNHIKIQIDDFDASIHSDTKWLQFIINQIVLNSIKYRKASPKIHISVVKNRKATILSITDNGIGIKKSELSRLTEKGFTGSNDRKTKISTGMGLYIANRLARDLGHKITFESEEGKHTTVKIHFPRHNYYLLSDQ